MYEILSEIGIWFLLALFGTVLYLIYSVWMDNRRRRIIDKDFSMNKGNYFKGNLK
jgi:hypothetical protein